MADRHWAEVTGRERDRLPTVVVFTVQDAENGGAFLTALDIDGSEVAHLWLGSLAMVRQWAGSEYAEGDMGPWREIPDEVEDPATYALRQVR